MDIAHCTIDNVIYDISTFSALSLETRIAFKYALICNDCEGHAHYRKMARNGRPACFVAFHEENCIYKSKISSPRYDPVILQDVNSLIISDVTIDIDFSTYTLKQLIPEQNNRPTTSSTARSTYYKQYTKLPIFHKNVNRGLRTLLRMLMVTSSFKKSNIMINTGIQSLQARDLFVNFNEVTEDHVDKWRGYYGLVSYADIDMLWLNTSNKKSPSILISDYKKYIKSTFSVTSNKDLSNSAILVFGKLKISKHTDKWYVRISGNSPGHLFICLKK